MNSKDQPNQEPEKLKKYLESAEDYSVCMLNPEGRIISCNTGTERIKGFKTEEIINKSFSIFFTDEDKHLRRPEKALETALKSGYFQDEGWRVRSDGSNVWANLIITPLYNDKNELLGFSKITRNLTKKKKAVQELLESEKRYRLLVTGVKDYAIFMLDPSGHIISWNAGAENIKGYKASEILGKHFSTFYTKEDLDAGKPERELIIAAEKGKYEEEGWRVKKNGDRFWANVLITALFDEYDQLIGFSKVTRDLTEKRLHEHRYRLMIESVKDYGIFMLNIDGTVATWNKGAEKNKGYSEREILGKHFSIFFPKEDRKNGLPEEELNIALREGRFEGEGWRIRKDGSRFWANVVITPVYNDNQQLIGFSKVARDLTERKLAEQKYHLLVNEVKDYGIFMLDPKGYIRSWNKGAERIKGYSPEEIIGKHFSVFYPDEDNQRGKPEMELEVAAKEGRFEDEDWRIKKDGSRFWANVIITALFDDNHKLIGYSKVSRDLTERKKAEEALRKANEMKDEFIGVASHELKTPLTSLNAYLQLLERQLPEAAKPLCETYLNKANVYVKRLAALIRDLLDISKIQAGKLQYNYENFDIQQTVSDAIESVQHTHDSHKIILESEHKGEVIVNADKDRIEQVVTNLLTNAIKYSPGEEKVIVTVSQEKDFIKVAVKDFGLGIPEEDQKKIFERFYRISDNHSFISGLGIGLFISCQIVQEHKGKLWVESEEGNGSTFYFKIPI